jgi:hypothetical protein
MRIFALLLAACDKKADDKQVKQTEDKQTDSNQPDGSALLQVRLHISIVFQPPFASFCSGGFRWVLRLGFLTPALQGLTAGYL